MPEREYNPELYPPRISEDLQKALWWVGIGISCGWTWGFALAMIWF